MVESAREVCKRRGMRVSVDNSSDCVGREKGYVCEVRVDLRQLEEVSQFKYLRFKLVKMEWNIVGFKCNQHICES